AGVVPPMAYPADAAITTAATPAPESSDNSLGYLLGALAVLAVPLFAILAILPARRRRAAMAKPKVGADAADKPKRTEGSVETAKPVTVAVPAPATTTAQPAPITEGPYANRVATFSTASVPARGALPSNGAAVSLPARVPEDFEERDALLKRMAAARPDRANPFRHYKS